MPSLSTPFAVAIVVTFNPQSQTLLAVLQAVQPQVAVVVLVDNCSAETTRTAIAQMLGEGVEARWLGSNMGVAAAQNVGILRAMELGATHVLLMDQDSVPEPDMVQALYGQIEAASARGIKVAAAGARFRDRDGGRLSDFVRVQWLRIALRRPKPGEEAVETDFLISSGALIPLGLIAQVGLMDEGLFIDHVDTEWCLRAKSKGLILLGVPLAVMTHTLGERRRELWFLRTRSISFHKPFRYYYIYRNSVLLYKRNYMPLRWKLADFVRCLKMMLVFSLLHDQRLACLKMMAHGVFDGLLGRTGKLGGDVLEKRNATTW